VAQSFLCTLITIDAWLVVSHDVLLLWSLLSALSILALFVGRVVFRSTALASVPPRRALQRWRWAHPLLLSIVGLPWGGLVFLMSPVDSVHNFIILVACVGVLGYSALSNAPNDPVAFFVSMLIVSVLLISQLPDIYGDRATVISVRYVLFCVVLLLAARNARKTLLTSIQLQLRNEALAKTNAENARRAEEANRDKSAFLAAASHDLRQPVHALLLLIEAYNQQEPGSAHHPLMQHITAAGQSIRSMFVALMELSQLESGTEKPTKTRINLHETLSASLENIRPLAQSKGIDLRCRVSTKLPSPVIVTDKLWLERILNNLLSNAVKYTVSGGVLLSLRNQHGGGLLLEVWDTGVGISPVDQARIFDPYVQIDNRERDRSKGLGLGLAIVRHAAHLLDMQVSVHSRLGRGSCLRLHLPATLFKTNSLDNEQLPTHLISANAIPARYLVGRRLLLIDDDPIVRQAMTAILSGWGIDLRYESVGAPSVLNACANGWEPECVISDFRLPGPLDGIALLDLVLERFPDAVGILQTGEQAAAVKERAEDAGYLVLFKPVDAASLASTLNAVLQPPVTTQMV
jgi:two-component system, sensor histidine kinase